MTWAERRRLTYIFWLIIAIATVFLVLYLRATSGEATCFDGKQNGDERGVDCSGSCVKYCPAELADPKVRWVRTFSVTPSVVHAVAYVEHGYPTAGSPSAQYSFRLYDEKNTLITERIGTTYIGPMGKTAIVDTLIPIGNTPVGRVQFSFIGPIDWRRISAEYASAVINTDRTIVEYDEGVTRVISAIENRARYTFDSLEVVAILYDIDGNALAASKALLVSLPALSEEVMTFTWPYRVNGVSRIEIIPRINPFDSTPL